VAFNGSLFQSQCDTGKSPLFSKHWLCLATAGVDGKPIRHRGEFAADIEYREHDAVLVGGSSVIALRDGPGTCPGSRWQLIASQGKRGAADEKRARLSGPEGRERAARRNPLLEGFCNTIRAKAGI
jgi:hypothetical protein